jgi:photosystem II stability/assembly factor-like uncharacterized protein
MKKLILFTAIIFLCHNLFSQWVHTNGPYNSTVSCLASHGTKIFVGTNNSGVYISSNNGVNWTAINNGLTDSDIHSLLVNGTNIYAGTLSSGAFLSTNNGASWTSIKNGLTNLQVEQLFALGSTVYAGTYGKGVFKTSNNGTTWTASNTGIASMDIISSTVFGRNLIIGTYYYGAFVSKDSGATWTNINNGLPLHPNVNSLASFGSKLYLGGDGGNVYLSNDTGATWTLLGSGIPTTAYIWSLAVDSTHIYAGTFKGLYVLANNDTSWSLLNSLFANVSVSPIAIFNNNFYANSNFILYRSSDGLTWNNITNGLPTDVYSLIINGTNIFAGSDGRVFLTTDGGANWVQRASGLSGDKVNALATNGSYIFAGQENETIYRSSDNGTTWTASGTGFGASACNSFTVCGGYIFASDFSGIYKSSDGSYWSATTSPYGNDITTLTSNGKNIFAGSNYGIFRSVDFGTTWSPQTLGNFQINTPNYMSAVVANGAIVYAGVHCVTNNCNSGVGLSTDTGEVWQEVCNGLTNLNINALALSGTNVFAGTDNGIFATISNGANWTAINTGMTDILIRSLAINGDTIYAGTHCGVWKRSISEILITVDINENTSNSIIRVYPNPATSDLNIEAPQNAIIEILNIEGQRLKTIIANENHTIIDISDFAKGLYFVKVKTAMGFEVKKFIKE